jgi:hypothetical protein
MPGLRILKRGLKIFQTYKKKSKIIKYTRIHFKYVETQMKFVPTIYELEHLKLFYFQMYHQESPCLQHDKLICTVKKTKKV